MSQVINDGGGVMVLVISEELTEYRKIFVDHNGPGPWPCDYCDDPVEYIGRGSPLAGNVHHKDHDHWNDEPSNLGIMHAACHTKHHGPPTEEQREMIRVKLKGRVSPTKGTTTSAETKAKQSLAALGDRNGFYGKTHSEENIMKMRKPRRRETCADCGKSYALNWINRHKANGRCV